MNKLSDETLNKIRTRITDPDMWDISPQTDAVHLLEHIEALQAELEETQNLLEVPDMVPVLEVEAAWWRGHLAGIIQKWIAADAEAVKLKAEITRLREALEYVAKFDGHHYAPLRACGEEAVKALKQNAVQPVPKERE